ncbi:MAG: fumarylacetoacetate hydrolase family protein [Myxococcota bacterium]
MKLCTFIPKSASSSSPRLGALMTDGQSIADLQQGALARGGTSSPHLADALAFLDGAQAAREAAEQALDFLAAQKPPNAIFPLSDVQLLAPVPRPRSIRDCMAFEQHVVRATRTVVKWHFAPLAHLDALVEKVAGRALIGAPRVWYQQPLYYKSNPFSVVGTDVDVIWPRYTEKLDYELEFGVFIGKQGKDIPREKAREHMAAFTIFNDFSARDAQLKEMQGRLGPAKGKDFDTGNAMGPWLVTADEVPDPYALTMVARVNGQEWSRGSSKEMGHTFEEIIAHVSQDETLYPGEFIGSGTAPGGCGLELDRWLKPGDVVELEVQGLGVLRNRVVRRER